MSRKPFHVHTNSYFRVTAKNVKKQDRIQVGSATMTVQSNRKNRLGGRVLKCSVWGSSALTTLVLPKDLKVRVQHSKITHPKK